MNYHPNPDWGPRDISVLGDQRRAYDEMRERCPVAYSDFLDWSLFRHQDIISVLADAETYSSASKHLAVPNGMDPPEHTQYRSVLEPYFRPEQMMAIEPQCRRIAVDLLQAFLARDEVEFISEFAQPFLFKTLCTFLGLSSETWENLRGWTHGNQEAAFSQDREAGAALAREFAGYVTEALRVRREAGVDANNDLISSLMVTTAEGAALSDEEIVSLLRNWTAGQGTVAAALGILVYYLAEHADVQQQLRREPTLLPAAIDEILRADGPLIANRRTTTHDVEIGGRKIGAGEKLSLNWIAANRDGRAFDDPDAVRFERDPGGNLLFGAGIHYCLGAPLARLEMRIAMEELLTRTTTIEPGATEPLRRDVYPSNGFQALPVRQR
ncbi:MAG: cytochrome P450 [Candidatus Chloroheliales bacterium]|nr:MAG: cytochrome P450 [Chloroflexota bacterium]